MHVNPKRVMPVVLILVILAASGWYLINGRAAMESGPLSASGMIEATQIDLAAELGGKVSEVLVEQGELVEGDQVLVRFDDQLLLAQRAQAEAALHLAQAAYDQVAAGTPPEQRQAAIAAAELEVQAAQQALDNLHENLDLAAAQVSQQIATLDKSLDYNQDLYTAMSNRADQVDIDAAQAAVVLAKDQLDKALKDFEPYSKKSEDNVIRASLQAKLAAAQQRYDAVVQRLNNLLGSANAIELAVVEAQVGLLQAQLIDLRGQQAELEQGPDPDLLTLAESRLTLAQAQLTLAKSGPSAEQLAVAQAQVEAARAALGVIDAQLAKLLVHAPLRSIVLSRSVEPGEVSAMGAPLLVLARLDDLTITVYLPEDRYGAVILGQQAQVTVDSFPGETFTGSVVYIADRAEFTPRNVQTAEGRRTTVFAIRLSLENTDGRLKPGMPADVAFDE